MALPSNTTPAGAVSTGKVPVTEPLRARRVTLFAPWFATQIWVPSKQIASGCAPTANVPRIAPSRGSSFTTELLLNEHTHSAEPSKHIPRGVCTVYAPLWTVLSLALIFVRALLP